MGSEKEERITLHPYHPPARSLLYDPYSERRHGENGHDDEHAVHHLRPDPSPTSENVHP